MENQQNDPQNTENTLVQPPKTDEQTPENNQSLIYQHTPSVKAKPSKKKLFIVVGVVILTIITVSLIFLLSKKLSPPSNNNTENQSREQTNSSSENNTIKLNAIFLDNREPLTYQPIYSDDGLKEFSGAEDVAQIKNDITFHKIGSVPDGELILSYIPTDALGPSSNSDMIIKKGDSYTLLAKHSTAFDHNTQAYIGPKLTPDTKLDNNTVINQLIIKETISYNDITASKVSNYASSLIDIDTKELTEVAKINEGTVYERVFANEHHPGVKFFSIYLKQPSGLYVTYRYSTDLLKDDNSMEIKFNDGSTSNEKYSWETIRGGCGVVDTVNVVDKAYFNDLVEVGTSNGEKVYQFKTFNNPAEKATYEQFDSSAVSQQDFHNNHGLIVVRNKLGYRVILVNQKYQRQGECGKPVIYLYPDKVTKMNVRVGADITKSIPEYGNGWDVLAMPNGTIVNKDGKKYPYLFWEGTGHGVYPKITEGFIVKSSNIEQELKNHLNQLGLNQRETDDFMEFWLPLMPKTNYTRLTWFNTQQMNQLAPLSLSQKPDTSIRVFLDFEGLEEPINLKPQKLTHPERKGFVLIEWGGLRFIK